MTTAKFVRLIFLKDVRAMRYFLLCLFALAGAILYYGIYPDPPTITGNSTEFHSSSFFPPTLIGVFFLIFEVIQMDAPGRELRFLFTRPVPILSIALSKALFLTFFLIIPYWLGHEVILLAKHISLSLTDHLFLMIETVVSSASCIACVVLLSIFFRNKKFVFLGVAISLLLGVILMAWVRERSFQGNVLPHGITSESVRLSDFQFFLASLVFLITSSLAIGLRYRTKGLRIPLTIAVGGIALGFLASFFPFYFASLQEDTATHQPKLTAEELNRIHLNIISEPKTRQQPYTISGGEWNKIHYDNFNQFIQLDGVEPPYYAKTIGYNAILTLRSGKTIVSNYDDFNGHGGVGGIDNVINQVTGVATRDPYQKEQSFDLLTYLSKDLSKEDLSGATVKGIITLDIRRAYLAGTIPLRAHESFRMPRRCCEITEVDFMKESVQFNLNFFQVPLIFRGNQLTWNPSDDLRWFAIYRPYNETLFRRSGASGGGGSFGIRFFEQNLVHTCETPLKQYGSAATAARIIPNWRPFPPDWEKDTELVFVASESCGQVSLPYEINNVDLKNSY